MPYPKIPFADARYLCAILNPFRNKVFVDGAIQNLKFLAYKHDVVGREIFKRRIYEPDLTNWILEKYAGKNSNFIDVGANLGYFSCLFGVLAGNGQVVSIEPEPNNLSLLRSNLSINNLSNVSVFPVAVGDKPGVATLNIYGKRNLGRHSLLEVKSEQSIDVVVSTIDDLIEEYFPDIPSFSLIKIDVEGYETFVIRGAKKTLSKTRALVLEFNPNPQLFSEAEAHDFFSSLGGVFGKIYEIDRGLREISISECVSAKRQMNLIFER